jgi:hypothetical protein
MPNHKNREYKKKDDDKPKPARKSSRNRRLKQQNAISHKGTQRPAAPQGQPRLSEELAQYEPPVLPRETADQSQEASLTSTSYGLSLQGSPRAGGAPQDQRFSLIIPIGKALKRRVLIELLAEHFNIDPLAAERRIVSGKGMLMHDLNYDTARKLQSKFRDAGQEVLIIAQHPGLEFGPPEEIFALNLSGSLLEVLTAEERIRVPRIQVILLACGGLRLAPGVLTSKSVLDLFCQNPKHHFRIWETTFDFKCMPVASTTLSEENFLNLANYLVKELPRAKATPQLITMIHKQLFSPQVFESTEEYDHYNQWVLLNHYGETV